MFRLKIVMLSVLLSGAVLVGFGMYSLSVMTRVNMDRIDQEITSLGQGHLSIGPPRGYWENFESSLKFIYGEERLKNLVVQILDPGNEILFKSSHWPAEIHPGLFPQFDRTMERMQPVRGGETGGDSTSAIRTTQPVAAENNASPGRRESAAGERRGPPQEAYRACEGKQPGGTSQFMDSQGEVITGMCEDENGTLVLRPDRNRAAQNAGRAELAAPSKVGQERSLPRIKKPVFITIQTPSGTWRAGIMGSERITMMVGVNMASYYEDAGQYRTALLGIVPFALLLLAAGGWVLAARALKPVALITRTAEGITAYALNQRIPPVDADKEIARLVDVINGMLERLEKSFGQAVRFSADAAHELQTPLTILQGELDDAVQHAPAGSEEQLRYSGLLEEVQRLKAIVQKLLILARADAGRLNLRLEPTDLTAMIGSAAEDISALAPHMKIETHIAPGVMVKADPDLLGQVVRNLTTNAVKYGKEDGTIRLQLSIREQNAIFTIANTGAAIPATDRDKIFDRFYRVDQSRSKAVSGAGLGLSLARELARAHHGELRLDPASNNVVSFTLMLPRV